MSEVLLSICIPAYNRPENIINILNRVTAFQSDEIEIVISDDNIASDVNFNVVRAFKDPRVKYFCNKKNLQYDANLLKAIEKSEGKFIFILMDDDEPEMRSLPWLLNTIKITKNLSQICGSSIMKGSEPASYVHKSEEEFFVSGEESLNALLFNLYHGSGIVLRRSDLDIQQAKKFIGFLYMQQVLVAQTLIRGDTLCTSRIFANIGTNLDSKQPLYKGRPYHSYVCRLLQAGIRIKIIEEIGKASKKQLPGLIEKQILVIYDNLFLIILEKKSLADLYEGTKIIIKIVYNSHSLIFLLKLMIYLPKWLIVKIRKLCRSGIHL